MDVIDLLSDSNDSNDSDRFNKPISPAKAVNDNIRTMRSIDTAAPVARYVSDDDMEFPEVPFAQEARKQNFHRAEPEPQLPRSNSKIEADILRKYFAENPIDKPAEGSKTKTGLTTADKEALKIQRSKNAEEAARRKAEKAANAEHIKSMKPGECMKYMKVLMDSNFQNFNFFDNLIKELQSLELEYHLKPQAIPNSITWKRTIQDYLNAGQEGLLSYEHQILIVWDYTEAVKKIADGTFVPSILSIQELVLGKAVTLIIYGTESYFRHHKNLKKTQIKNQCQGNVRDMTKRRGSKVFQELPVVSKKELELCLTEIQLRINCSSQLIETPQYLGAVISQYTKAIAEAPFKIQKKRAMLGQLDWYSAADNKDTVRVDKNGNGLKRLWQQQLCQFNLAKLETAEAIISQYPTPRHLMEAYAICSPSEGAQLLQDIVIRRTAGPLTAVRKIGPELSKKVYLMFTTEDGDVLLGNEGAD